MECSNSHPNFHASATNVCINERKQTKSTPQNSPANLCAMVLVTADPRNGPVAGAADELAHCVCGLPPCIEVHQLLAGREFAVPTQASRDRVKAFAAQMANYVYAVIDRRNNTAVLVDPCWDIGGIFDHVCGSLGARAITAAV